MTPIGRMAEPKNRAGVIEIFDNPSVQENIQADLDMIAAYDTIIARMELYISTIAKHHDPIAYALLKTIPGVGRVLGLTLLYEIENIHRFPSVQNFASYCRLVKCAKESNGKNYGFSGNKIGNPHLKWAFSEAITCFLKGNEPAKKYCNRLINKYGKAKALSIMAHRMGRAVYFMLKNKVPFDQDKFLGH
jgi:transposase